MGKKMMIIFFISGTLFFNLRTNSYASSFWTPDSDTALLFQVVSNTASQLNELEKLVTDAEKHTELLEKYNQIAKDHYFRAERIYYIAENYVELSKRNPADLEELNSAIRALKSENESLKFLIEDYRASEAQNEIYEKKTEESSRQNAKELQFANHQVEKTGEISSVTDASKLTAQNTGLIYKSNVENNQLSSLIANRLSEQNKILNRIQKDNTKDKEAKESFYQMKKRGDK